MRYKKYQIDKRIPLPPRKANAHSKYPWREMKPGDSFFVPHATHKWFTGGISNSRRKLGKHVKFAQRSVVEHGVNGIRIWRVS